MQSMAMNILSPTMRPGSIPPDLGFCFDRLFDTENYDHIDIERQLAKYKKRDLKQCKLFVTASKIFGAPLSRRRIIVAPDMEKVERKIFDRTCDYGEGVGTLPVGPQNVPETNPDVQEALEKAKMEISHLDEYHDWITERKLLREQLEGLGLNEEWIIRKPDKTPLERRVLRQLIEARTPAPETPKPEKDNSLEPQIPEILPSVHRPAPLAFKTLAKFIKDNNLRLIDMFKSVDKDKDWSLSRAEFKQMVIKHKIPVSDILLEDLLLALDSNLDNQIQYNELSQGLEQFKAEERQKSKEELRKKRKSDTEKPSTVQSGPTLSTRTDMPSSANSHVMETHFLDNHSTKMVRPPLSPIMSHAGSPTHLEPPPHDVRGEQMILSSDEAMLDLRKRDREALARLMGKKLPTQRKKKANTTSKPVPTKTMVKTGNKAVDDHMRPSTLVGEVGDMVDKFRQLKYKEYLQVLKLCKEKNVDLDEKVLEKVLLYPPDKPHCQIKKKIRIPGSNQLMTSHFADPPAKPRTPIEVKHKDRIKKSKSGQLLIDSRHVYPEGQKVAPVTTKMYLSSGRAFVRRKVDCWMSFEEYDRLTSNFAIRYKQLHGAVDDNAFWPGHLLNKMRLCMDDPRHEPGSNSIFRPVQPHKRSNYGYDNDLNDWPVNDAGYVQFGHYDPYERKY